MPDSTLPTGETVVLGERELAIGFRLIGISRVVEVTPETAGAEFQRVMSDGSVSLLIASQSIRPRLTDAQRAAADASLTPLVVF
ncbi:vacuolar h+transporting two sector atpase f subunit, partial [mine drainage metagenome]